MTIPHPTSSSRTGKFYDRVGLNEPLSPDGSDGDALVTPAMDTTTTTTAQQQQPPFVVVVLDGMQRKFRVPATPETNVARFKEAGTAVHHVEAVSQRLIHRGKMLRDDATLRDCGIDTTETIVHLFPKPKVVLTNHNNGSSTTSGESGDADGGDEERPVPPANTTDHGAHVPRIVLDAEEARRASSMVIFTSSEMFEAQARVKLLSFFLLFMCSMELLTLLSMVLGAGGNGNNNGGWNNGPGNDAVPPGDPTDSTYSDGGGVDGLRPLRTWRTSDFADLAVSGFGFYVATLGLRATAENTSESAKRYYYGLLTAGVGWLGYNYYVSLQLGVSMNNDIDNNESTGNESTNGVDDTVVPEDETNQHDRLTQRQLYLQALFGLVVPLSIWCYCFMRAWQFKKIILEAEVEAEERHGRFMSREYNNNNHNQDDRSASGDRTTYVNAVMTLVGDGISEHRHEVAFGGDRNNYGSSAATVAGTGRSGTSTTRSSPASPMQMGRVDPLDDLTLVEHRGII